MAIYQKGLDPAGEISRTHRDRHPDDKPDALRKIFHESGHRAGVERDVRILGEDEIMARVREKLEFVDLNPDRVLDQLPSDLSGGMRKRVGIARGMANNPKIMLYDEPTAGLDPVTSKKINELIIALRDIKSVTGVFVTHRMRDAFTLATEYASNGGRQISFHTEDNFVCIANTRFLMLRDGTIIFEGPDEVLRRSKDEYIKRFLA